MRNRTWIGLLGGIGIWVILSVLPIQTLAGAFEVSSGFSFNRSNYTNNNFSWTRRWGASLGYHFSERSEVEVAFQDIVDRTFIEGYEDTTFHDRIYSVNWVQEFFGKNTPFQPYFKVGVGQLNRSASGTYAGGASPPALVDSLTGVLGAGLRIHLSRTFGIRTEATTYLARGSIRTWKDNVSLNVGFSVYF